MKDRAALSMLNAAEEAGLLKPGGTIVEQTSGNTGIGLAAFAAERGYKLDIFLERGASLERRLMLLAYGARLLDYKDATGERPETKRTHPWQEPEREATLDEIAAYCRRTGAYFNNQAANPANPEAHYRTTGPEIWQDTEGHVDILVCMAGTGGTGFGTASYPASPPALAPARGGCASSPEDVYKRQVRVLRQSLRLLRSRQLDVQDAILELCVDVFFLHNIAHVEAARAGAGEGFAPQIAALLILFVIAVAAHCLNGQVLSLIHIFALLHAVLLTAGNNDCVHLFHSFSLYSLVVKAGPHEMCIRDRQEQRRGARRRGPGRKSDPEGAG